MIHGSPGSAVRWGAVGAAALLASACVTARAPKDGKDAWQRAEEAGHKAVEALTLPEGARVALVGATVWPVDGERIDAGYVVFDAGRIAALGAGEPTAEALGGAHVIDAKGMHVTPGIIDSHSHMGVYPVPGASAHGDGNEGTAPVTAGVWAEHSVWPQDPSLERALAGGTTTIQVLPGSANLVGGRAVTLHLHPARGARAMRFPGAPDGLKMACGENPKRVYGEKGRAPSTRMGNLRGQREAFANAEAYLRKVQAGARVERDLEAETLAGVLRGDLLLHVHCYRADDMISFLQVADEFGFEVRSFHHALEAYKIRDILAERGISVSTWADWWGFKLEAYDGIPDNLAFIEEAGGRPVVHSDSHVGVERLNQEAAKALAAGRRAGLPVSEDDAMRWLTLNAAWSLGIDDQVGTLTPGKRADVVVWTSHPLSVYARPRWVFVDGLLRYDLERPGAPWSDFEAGQEVAP